MNTVSDDHFDYMEKDQLEEACRDAYRSMWRSGCLTDGPIHTALNELRAFAKEIIESVKDGRI